MLSEPRALLREAVVHLFHDYGLQWSTIGSFLFVVHAFCMDSRSIACFSYLFLMFHFPTFEGHKSGKKGRKLRKNPRKVCKKSDCFSKSNILGFLSKSYRNWWHSKIFKIIFSAEPSLRIAFKSIWRLIVDLIICLSFWLKMLESKSIFFLKEITTESSSNCSFLIGL